METYIPYLFRFLMYTLFGLTMEAIYAAHSVDLTLFGPLKRRVPKKYLEGFVSLYMIPLHGLGLLFGFEAVHALIADWFIVYRFIVWAIFITVAEIGWGFFLDKLLGFYPWDYYADSRFKIGKRGYSLWTLVPMWGFAGLMIEVYSDLMIYLSPHVVTYFR